MDKIKIVKNPKIEIRNESSQMTEVIRKIDELVERVNSSQKCFDELLAIGKQITKELQLFLDEKSYDTDRLNEIHMRANENDDALFKEWCSKERKIL